MKKFFSVALVCCLLAGCVHGRGPAFSSGSAVAQGMAVPPGAVSGAALGAASGQPAAVAQPSAAYGAAVPFARKRVGLVAHDARKPELLAWVKSNAALLAKQEIFSTGTTGRLVAETLKKALPGSSPRLTRFHSGPLGGDQQMGALVSEKGLDILIFFVDPMSSHPHSADIQALLRLCRVYNVVVATTPATADYVISSPLFVREYTPHRPEYSSYVNRKTP